MKIPPIPVCVFFKFYISDVKKQQFTYTIVRPNSPPQYLLNTKTDGKKAGWNDFRGTINSEQGDNTFKAQMTIYRDLGGLDTLMRFTSFKALDGRCDKPMTPPKRNSMSDLKELGFISLAVAVIGAFMIWFYRRRNARRLSRRCKYHICDEV